MNPNDLRFTPFRAEHQAALEEMVLGMYSEDSYGEKMTPEKVRATVKNLTERPDAGQIVMFELGGRAIGYAILIHFWSNEYGGPIQHVDELYVRPENRLSGVAGRFFEAVRSGAFGDVRALRLEVTPTNERACEYYRRVGFEPEKNLHMFWLLPETVRA